MGRRSILQRRSARRRVANITREREEARRRSAYNEAYLEERRRIAVKRGKQEARTRSSYREAVKKGKGVAKSKARGKGNRMDKIKTSGPTNVNQAFEDKLMRL